MSLKYFVYGKKFYKTFNNVKILWGTRILSIVDFQKIVDSCEEDYFLLDYQKKKMFKEFHLQNAINIELKRIQYDDKLEDYLPKNKLIIIYGKKQIENAKVAKILESMGYETAILPDMSEIKSKRKQG